VHLVGLIIKKFVTMHSHMNVKISIQTLFCSQTLNLHTSRDTNKLVHMNVQLPVKLLRVIVTEGALL